MYINNLNYFRGLLAIFVVLIHLNQILLYPLYYSSDKNLFILFSNVGVYSVIGFIMISGYSMFYSLEKNYEKFGYINIIYYLRKRALRIYPPLFATLLLMIILYSIIYHFQLHGFDSYRLGNDLYVPRERFELNFQNIFLMLFFLPRVNTNLPVPAINGPLWSLSFEVWYYFIILFIFVAFFTKKNIVRLLMTSILIAILMYEFNSSNRQFLYLLIVFLIGATGRLITYKKININKKLLICLILLCLLILLLLYYVIGNSIFIPYNSDSSYIVMLINSIIIMIIVSFYKNKTLLLSSLFFSISKYSYSLYILHFPIFLFIFSFSHKYLLNFNGIELFVFISITILFILSFSSFFAKIFESKDIAIFRSTNIRKNI